MKLANICMAALAAMALASCHCSDKGSKSDGRCDDDEKVYAGILPAADAPGISCVLELDYDNAKTGDYEMTQTYRDPSDSVRTIVEKSKGDFVVHQGTPADATQEFLELTPRHRDRAEDNASNHMFFLITGPSTIEMVGPGLAPIDSVPGYTLTLQPGKCKVK